LKFLRGIGWKNQSDTSYNSICMSELGYCSSGHHGLGRIIEMKIGLQSMRINAKGQVTIPARIRKQAGLLPNTEVEFAYDGGSEVRLFRRGRISKKKSCGEALVAHMRGKGDIDMTTEEIMALTRGPG
jgi:AbrB family looped-hinge helix DNA binding protein